MSACRVHRSSAVVAPGRSSNDERDAHSMVTISICMRRFNVWRCALCEAIFKFDAEMTPLRCPDCLSSKEHLYCVEQASLENNTNTDDRPSQEQ